MKIWLDDVREPPDASWTWAQSSAAAIALLTYPGEAIEAVSLDHDLGTWDTGMKVARFIAGMDQRPPNIAIHSMNPVGAENMRRVLEESPAKETCRFLGCPHHAYGGPSFIMGKSPAKAGGEGT